MAGDGGPPAAFLALAARPGRAALFVDYDGTLAPIVADPAGARPLAGAPHVLARLAGRFGLVAVVSGRPVDYLRAALGDAAGVHLVGLYGLEWLGADATVHLAPEAEPWRAVVTHALHRARAGAPAGLELEAKGLSFTLHWRRHPETQAWARVFGAEEQARSGLVPHDSRMALELRPPLALDKGTAVAALAADFDPLAYLGDDLADLPAFAAFRELAGRGRTVLAVAVTDAESPPAVAAAGDLVVHGPEGALALLEGLAG